MLPQWLPHWADVLMADHDDIRTKRGPFSAYSPDPCTSVSLAIQQQPVCGMHLLPDCYPPSTDATSCRALYMKAVAPTLLDRLEETQLWARR